MGRLDEHTKEALRAYVNGTVQHPAMTPSYRRIIEVFLFNEDNWDELAALREAEERGDVEKLAELAETKGLRTTDARAYNGARLRGENQKRGKKLTVENSLRRIKLFLEVRDYMHTFEEIQADALKRASKTRSSFVEKAFDIYAEANGGKEPVGEMREFLDHLSKEAETDLRDDFKKGRNELRDVLETLKFSVGPALQVKKNNGDTK